MSILKDTSGGWSSKRTVGLAYAALGIVMVLVGLFTEKVTDMDILIVVVGTSMTALGISNFSKSKITTQGTVDPTKPGGSKT